MNRFINHIFLILSLCTPITSFTVSNRYNVKNTHTYIHISTSRSTTKLHSLKPAAIPLLDAGKALARSGELLIEYTSSSTYKLYGGGLSSSGASIRNAGDCVAQAAASSRFKTASELVCDELREAATCMLEGSNEKLLKGVDDAKVDENFLLSNQIRDLIPFMECAGVQLEMAGEKIMKRESVGNIGTCLVESSDCLYSLALGIQKLGSSDDSGTSGSSSVGNATAEQDNEESIKAAKESCNRMLYAAEKMKEAGNNLKGVQPIKKKGKSWLKG